MRRVLLLLFVLMVPVAAVETQLLVTATDDGLPSGTVTYTWTTVSQPVAATGSNAAQILTTPSAGIPSANAQNPRVVLRVAGTYTFRVAVSDGNLTTTDTSGSQDVTIVVHPVANTAPTISAIGDQLIARGTSTAAIPFTVSDTGGTLTVTVASSNTTLVPASGVVLAGTGNNRTITVTPVGSQSGTTTITVTVTDSGGLSSQERFQVTVNAPPAITRVSAAQTTLTLP